jgi:hypothetical protein
MTPIMMRAISQVLAFGLLAITPSQSLERAWPQLNPVKVRFKVDLSLERIVIDLPLRDQDGRQRYHFACRGVRESYLDSLKENWVGPLMCTLAEGTEAREESLLSEDDSAAWFSRGQFRREELVGDCAEYPEFGLHRSFRLRGFRLNLDVENVAVDASGRARAFVLAVSVAQDGNARSEQAERPGFLDPRGQGKGCKVVTRGAEPRMCRDWEHGGSWALCKN